MEIRELIMELGSAIDLTQGFGGMSFEYYNGNLERRML